MRHLIRPFLYSFIALANACGTAPGDVLEQNAAKLQVGQWRRVTQTEQIGVALSANNNDESGQSCVIGGSKEAEAVKVLSVDSGNKLAKVVYWKVIYWSEELPYGTACPDGATFNIALKTLISFPIDQQHLDTLQNLDPPQFDPVDQAAATTLKISKITARASKPLDQLPSTTLWSRLSVSPIDWAGDPTNHAVEVPVYPLGFGLDTRIEARSGPCNIEAWGTVWTLGSYSAESGVYLYRRYRYEEGERPPSEKSGSCPSDTLFILSGSVRDDFN